MIAAVGRDPQAEEALAGLRAAGVELVLQESEAPTGVALIQVDAEGETTIAVAPGANATLGAVDLPPHDAVLCQLEIPDDAVLAAWEECTGLFCLNAAPARPIAVDADLTVVNRHELETLVRRDGLVALTLGAEGAVLLDDGEEIARAAAAARRRGGRDGCGRRVHRVPARVAARGALARGSTPSRVRGRRPRGVALRGAAVAADRCRGRRDPRSGIIVRMPTPIILDCDPGHDDAIALLLALGSPELELLGVTTTYGNQTLEKTTANALRVLELAGRGDVPVASGASAPLERELVVAAHVHGESGLDGPALPPPSLAPVSDDAVEWMAGAVADAPGPVTLVPTGPLTNIARYLHEHGTDGIERIVLMGGAIAEGNMTPAAEFNVWADPEAAQTVLDAPLDVTMIGLDVTHKAVTGPDVQRRLRDAGSIGVFVAELVDFFTVYHRETYGWDGAPIHDAVAVAHVLRPGLVETKLRNVEVERDSELCRGRTVVDLWRRTDRSANAHVGVDLDSAAFFDLLVERVSRLG